MSEEPMTKLEEAALVAKIESDTGVHVAQVEHVTLAAPLKGFRCACGNEIKEFFFVQWCDECFDVFEAAEGDKLTAVQERWRANGWVPTTERK